MESLFINAGLAAGIGLAALPVILHLFMRPTPKRIIFPALQLVRTRHKRARKSLKVKNWLLLLARMALVALMALALARPRLYSNTPLGDQEVPSAIGLVFDTSLSMQYEEKGKNRLAEAKERANAILTRSAEGSQVFVVDSAEPGEPQTLSPSAAKKRIEGLTLRAANRPLNAAMGQAYAAVAGSDRARKEVYVLTDLAASAWDLARPADGLEKAHGKGKTKAGGIDTFVLQLAPKEASDVGVVEAGPSSGVTTQGDPVEIRAKVRGSGKAARRVAELWLDDKARDKKVVESAADAEVELRFNPLALEPGLHRGLVKLTGGPDPLAFDDVRYFSFQVRPAVKVLIVSDLAIDAVFVAKALQPDAELVGTGVSQPYKVERLRPSELADRAKDALKAYACVFWLDVARPTPADWGRLEDYVRDGGGLTIALGPQSRAEAYNEANAGSLLPAVPKEIARPAAPTTFARADFAHPLFAKYPRELDGLLSAVPVARYWKATLAAGSRAILSYADGSPALVERTFKGPKTGRVLLWTSPLSRRTDPDNPAAWSEFASPTLGWSFFYLINQTVAYLGHDAGERLNYEAGEDVILPLDPARRFSGYLIQGPDAKTSDRQTPSAASTSLVVVAPQPVGQWTVLASRADGSSETLGFSVNAPLAETRIAPLRGVDLDALLGKGHYQLADTAAKLTRAVADRRVGREIFPWIMALILAVLTAENLLANKFHRESGAPVVAGSRA